MDLSYPQILGHTFFINLWWVKSTSNDRTKWAQWSAQFLIKQKSISYWKQHNPEICQGFPHHVHSSENSTSSRRWELVWPQIIHRDACRSISCLWGWKCQRCQLKSYSYTYAMVRVKVKSRNVISDLRGRSKSSTRLCSGKTSNPSTYILQNGIPNHYKRLLHDSQLGSECQSSRHQKTIPKIGTLAASWS